MAPRVYPHLDKIPLKDCHGINCPLGIAHPPPHWDPKKGGVFPLGCGICRSEKLSILANNNDFKQAVQEDNLPKAWIRPDWRKKEPEIDRPLVEIEMPDFIALAEEIEEERIRILNKTPVPVMSARQMQKKRRAEAKKARLLAE